MIRLPRFVLILLLAVGIAGCAARTDIRGNLLTESQIAEIKIGETDRATINRLLGPPSTEGTFDAQVWYYIGRHTSQWAFLGPEVLDQRVVAIYFDGRGIVEHVERYGYPDARLVGMVDRETPTSGHALGFFEQIWGNLGFFPRQTAGSRDGL